MKRLLMLFFAIILLLEPSVAAEKGAVTNLPLPRFVSLKASKANARRGPSLSHRIDWVYKRKQMPLEIYAEYENWRRVRDIEGAGGWVHYSLLSGVRTVILTVNMQPLTKGPDENSNIVARFEKDVIAEIKKCYLDWCQLTSGGYKGWVPKTSLWGVHEKELKD
jgi:SH3-like domain-containing protein